MQVVFIGGTGLCGTNVLKNVLSLHPKVSSLPFEHRIFLDPDGIVDFLCTFPDSWSPYLADVRLRRLEQFLRDLAFRTIRGRYADWELHKHIPGFWEYCECLMASLVQFSFSGSWEGWFNGALEEELESPEFFFSSCIDRGKLIEILSAFVSYIIEAILSKKKGATCYVDDGTWNILAARELLELVPGAKIIHIYKDPRDVICSCVGMELDRFQIQSKRWAPGEWGKATEWYVGIMKHWTDEIFPSLPESSVLQLSLEELVQDSEYTLRTVCDFIGIGRDEAVVDSFISKDRANLKRWKEEMPTDILYETTDRTSRFIRLYGECE